MTEATSKSLVFTDTNIWLYTLLANQDANKAETANQLIDQHTGNVAMSSQVVVEIVANLVKKASQVGASILYSEDMHDGLIIDKQLTMLNPFASR